MQQQYAARAPSTSAKNAGFPSDTHLATHRSNSSWSCYLIPAVIKSTYMQPSIGKRWLWDLLQVDIRPWNVICYSEDDDSFCTCQWLGMYTDALVRQRVRFDVLQSRDTSIHTGCGNVKVTTHLHAQWREGRQLNSHGESSRIHSPHLFQWKQCVRDKVTASIRPRTMQVNSIAYDTRYRNRQENKCDKPSNLTDCKPPRKT